MNGPSSPEPSSEQLLAFLDAEIARQRSSRRRGGRGAAIRVGLALLIFAVIALALGLLTSSLPKRASADGDPRTPRVEAEASGRNF